MCRVLHLSESGYYRWLRNRGRHSSRQLLAGKVKKILEEHPDNRNYGVDRVCLALEQDGVDVSRRTVYRVMKENGWLHKRRIPHGITKTTTEAQEQENLLKRDFSAQRPLEKFLTDITEVQCADGKLYVSPIMDCFSGEIVALEMRDNRKKELCIDTVRQLERIYPSLKGAVFHSDRGSQYSSAAFRAELSRCGMIQSLSGTGHCFDNARMESFFATLKKEKIYQIAAYKLPREQVKTIIFRYIFIYYNRVRVYTRNPMEMSRNVQSGNTQNLKSMVCHCVDADYAQNKKQEETNMTIDSAKDLQMNIAKEGLALLMLHPSLDVQLHRECIFLIGTAWDIPVGDTQEVISLLDRELDAIRAAGEGGTVAHVLPEDELSMNAIGLETLDNIWDLFETSLRMDSMQARTKMFEMAKWLEESQNLLD